MPFVCIALHYIYVKRDILCASQQSHDPSCHSHTRCVSLSYIYTPTVTPMTNMIRLFSTCHTHNSVMSPSAAAHQLLHQRPLRQAVLAFRLCNQRASPFWWLFFPYVFPFPHFVAFRLSNLQASPLWHHFLSYVLSFPRFLVFRGNSFWLFTFRCTNEYLLFMHTAFRVFTLCGRFKFSRAFLCFDKSCWLFNEPTNKSCWLFNEPTNKYLFVDHTCFPVVIWPFALNMLTPWYSAKKKKLRFLGILRFKFKCKIWSNLKMYRGIWDLGLVSFNVKLSFRRDNFT